VAAPNTLLSSDDTPKVRRNGTLNHKTNQLCNAHSKRQSIRQSYIHLPGPMSPYRGAANGSHAWILGLVLHIPASPRSVHTTRRNQQNSKMTEETIMKERERRDERVISLERAAGKCPVRDVPLGRPRLLARRHDRVLVRRGVDGVRDPGVPERLDVGAGLLLVSSLGGGGV
jgi:hypothetical protein